MAVIIKANGTIQPIKPKNRTDFQWEELKEIVGGYIEVVRLRPSDKIFIVNDEGKLQNLPYNAIATAMYNKYTYPYRDDIVGDVLFCNSSEVR